MNFYQFLSVVGDSILQDRNCRPNYRIIVHQERESLNILHSILFSQAWLDIPKRDFGIVFRNLP